MAKTKSRAELKEDLKAAKEESKVARTEKREFEKENKLEKDTDHSGHEKHGKRWNKLNDMAVKKTKAVEDLQASYDAAKPEKVDRVSKYDYPLVDGKEMDAIQKKKFRTAARAAAAKALKGETTPKKEKKDKKEEAAPAAEGEKKLSKAERKAAKKAEAKTED